MGGARIARAPVYDVNGSSAKPVSYGDQLGFHELSVVENDGIDPVIIGHGGVCAAGVCSCVASRLFLNIKNGYSWYKGDVSRAAFYFV